MKINLKYLAFLILIPLSVMASNSENELTKLIDNSRTLNEDINKAVIFLRINPDSDSDSPVTITSSTVTSDQFLTFNCARNLWCFGDKAEKNEARPTIHYFLKTKEAGTHFGKSYAFLLAPHVWQLGNEADKAVVKNYIQMLLFNGNHQEYDNIKKIIYLS